MPYPTDAPTATVADGFVRVKRAAAEIVDWPWPLPLVKAVLGASLACNPGPHVTDLGIADGSVQQATCSGLTTTLQNATNGAATMFPVYNIP